MCKESKMKRTVMSASLIVFTSLGALGQQAALGYRIVMGGDQMGERKRCRKRGMRGAVGGAGAGDGEWGSGGVAAGAGPCARAPAPPYFFVFSFAPGALNFDLSLHVALLV